MKVIYIIIHSGLSLGHFCRLLITFANSLDPDQYRQNISPDLNPNSLTLIVLLKELLFKKSAVDNKNMKIYPACEKLKSGITFIS